MKKMNILGIDPGLATTGFALLKDENLIDFGVIRTHSGKSLSNRLLSINDDLLSLILEHKPDIAAVEKLFFVKNITNGISVAHARGVILYILEQQGIPIREVSPKDVKLSVCGYGNAEKIQMQKVVQQIFQLSAIPSPDDAADAIAIAYWASRNI
jgi:crossover junction endodeoxyribonuclease RuvC